MTPADLCQAIQAAGMTFRADGTTLVLKPADRLTPALRDLLVEHKPELLAFLHDAQATTERLVAAAMRACDQWADTPAAREQMRQDIHNTPAHLRADLLEHLQVAYPKDKK